MSKPKILATHPLFDLARSILEARCDVQYWEKEGKIPRGELLARVRDKDGLVCLLTEQVDKALLDAAPGLRIVANVAVGYDNIDVGECTNRGVVATNTPGMLDETTADFAWSLMMAAARRLIEGDQLVRTGQWKGWALDQLCGADIWGKVLGIVGLGRIGRAVARRAAGFKMQVLYTDRSRAPESLERELAAEYREFDALLADSDFVSLHVPLTGETRGLISTAQFARMKPTAFLINTARGPIVDEAALVGALERGKIAGAALDVYEQEPFIHPGLRRPNVVLAPHLASASLETRTKMACMAAENVVARFSGRPPANALNPEVLAKQ
jgi:glyoxylate reductase